MSTCKLIKLGLAAAMLLSASAVSEAADAPRGPAYRPPPPPIPFYNWTGLYVGVHAGGGWADLGVGDTGSGFIGGGQVGYNYQINPQWVFGLEVDVSGTSVKNTLAVIGPMSVNFNWDTLTTLTPRFGWASDNLLVYAKAGGAWASVSTSVTGTPQGTISGGGGTGSGWVVGVGAEYAFRNNWSAKIEYNHFDFGSDTGVFLTGNSITFDAVKVGINYRFGGPGGPIWPFR
jgi:outer membrane immunogenic protein